MLKELLKHASEFRRALANFAYELTDTGILFPKSKLHIQGQIGASLLRREDKEAGANWRDFPFEYSFNRVVNQGIDHILNTALGGASQIATYYMAPFATNTTPGASTTAANFNSTLTEFTNYDEATRVEYVPVASTAQLLENSVTPALFTIADGVQTNVYGFGTLSVATKSATTGVLVGAALLSNPKLGLGDGDELRAKHRFTGSSV